MEYATYCGFQIAASVLVQKNSVLVHRQKCEEREVTMPRAANRREETPAYLDAARRAVRRGEEDVARAGVATTSLERRLEMLIHDFGQGFRLPRRSDRERAAKSEVAAIPARLEGAFIAKARVETDLVERRRELQVAEDRWAVEQDWARKTSSPPARPT